MAKTLKKGSSLVMKEAAVAYKTKRNSDHEKISSGLRNIKTPARLIKLNSKENRTLITYWLGGVALVPKPIHSDFDLLLAASEGIPKSSVDVLANHLGITRKSMAEDIFDLSVKTLERKAPSDKLDKKTSSHAFEIAKLMQHAYEVFEDDDKIKRWISRQNRALNGMKPLQLFNTLTGLSMVNDILGRIEEGVYS